MLQLLIMLINYSMFNFIIFFLKEDGKEYIYQGPKLNLQKTKIVASSPITSRQIDGETVANFSFWGSKITADGDCSHGIKRRSLE